MRQKVTAKEEGKRVWAPSIPEFITADSEASEAKSPRFENIVGAKVPTDAPGRVGTTPMEEGKWKRWKKKIPTSTSSGSEKVDPAERG